MKINKNVKFRKDNFGYIIFCEGQEMVVNNSGFDLINLFNEDISLENIKKQYIKKYKISDQTFEKEVEGFLKLLVRRRILLL